MSGRVARAIVLVIALSLVHPAISVAGRPDPGPPIELTDPPSPITGDPDQPNTGPQRQPQILSWELVVRTVQGLFNRHTYALTLTRLSGSHSNGRSSR